MRASGAAALAILALLATAAPCAARMHGHMYCWAFDSELPVPCEDVDDDEGDDGGDDWASRATRPAGDASSERSAAPAGAGCTGWRN